MALRLFLRAGEIMSAKLASLSTQNLPALSGFLRFASACALVYALVCVAGAGWVAAEGVVDAGVIVLGGKVGGTAGGAVGGFACVRFDARAGFAS